MRGGACVRGDEDDTYRVYVRVLQKRGVGLCGFRPRPRPRPVPPMRSQLTVGEKSLQLHAHERELNQMSMKCWTIYDFQFET